MGKEKPLARTDPQTTKRWKRMGKEKPKPPQPPPPRDPPLQERGSDRPKPAPKPDGGNKRRVLTVLVGISIITS